MLRRWIAVLVLAGALPVCAQVCNPRDVQGSYVFQLSGSTSISGAPRPVASLGLLEFDGEGGVSGTASTNFAGRFLGNPVNGKYETQADCSITWSLQDDSGALQHFSGVLTPDLNRATFRQTDPGGARHGTLAKMASACSMTGLQGTYRFAISGHTVPMQRGDTAHAVSLSGTLTIDAAGNVAIQRDGASVPAGTAEVDSNCEVHIIMIPAPSAEMTLRGALTAQREILAIQTDPGSAVEASFSPAEDASTLVLVDGRDYVLQSPGEIQRPLDQERLPLERRDGNPDRVEIFVVRT